MKAYKMTVLIIDHSGYGADEAVANLENADYVNPHVMSVEEADIGEWSDDHPLNQLNKQKAEFERIFSKPIPEGQWARTDSENDKPQDWLFTSLILTKALSKILKESEGIAITPENDMLKFLPLPNPEKIQSLIVHRDNGQIKITDAEMSLPDGEMIWMHKEKNNETI